MSRPPGTLHGLLALSTLGALGVHLTRLAPPAEVGRPGWMAVLLLVPALVYGRILLALLPPGPAGSHAPRELPLTLALSALLGALFHAGVSAYLETRSLPHLPAVVERVAVALLLAAGLARAMTLPGAMVPRHGVPTQGSPWLARATLLALTGWILYLLVRSGPAAVLWVALFVCVFHALGSARRHPAGRHAALLLGASCAGAGGGALPAAVALGLGACFLVPWLRRADRRAGALCGLAFGSLFLSGLDPLALVASLVFVGASPARLRRFAAAWVGVPAALCALRASMAPFAPAFVASPRRALWPRELAERALELEVWGLAWPIVVVGLALGALTFPWRARWTPGALEEPRREVLALAALLAGAVLALLVPWSPWYEEDALRLLFPPALLLAGLLLIPPERVAPGA